MGVLFSSQLYHPPEPPSYEINDDRGHYLSMDHPEDYDWLSKNYRGGASRVKNLALHIDLGYKVTVLFLHGNAEDIGMVSEYFNTTFCKQLKVNGFLPEYPGYGQSKGSPSESGLNQVAITSYKYLVSELNINPMDIVIYGRSLGTAPAIHLAALLRKMEDATSEDDYKKKANLLKKKASAEEAGLRELGRPRGMVLQTPFLSIYRILSSKIKATIPGDLYVSISKINDIQCPTLVIHGTNDEIVPYYHGEEIQRTLKTWAAAPLFLKGAKHSNIETQFSKKLYPHLRQFIDKLSLQIYKQASQTKLTAISPKSKGVEAKWPKEEKGRGGGIAKSKGEPLISRSLRNILSCGGGRSKDFVVKSGEKPYKKWTPRNPGERGKKENQEISFT
mmetsp:Transcript_45766/g.73605  ORF Transcript_45766/g.73605 Transcript_45766/m.73605 type:complete len:390 (+) Transcript_45766:113-1282(+)